MQTKLQRKYGYIDLIAYALVTVHEIDDEELKIFKKAI